MSNKKSECHVEVKELKRKMDKLEKRVIELEEENRDYVHKIENLEDSLESEKSNANRKIMALKGDVIKYKNVANSKDDEIGDLYSKLQFSEHAGSLLRSTVQNLVDLIDAIYRR